MTRASPVNYTSLSIVEPQNGCLSTVYGKQMKMKHIFTRTRTEKLCWRFGFKATRIVLTRTTHITEFR